jgi:hypothetical protein
VFLSFENVTLGQTSSLLRLLFVRFMDRWLRKMYQRTVTEEGRTHILPVVGVVPFVMYVTPAQATP